MRHGRIIAAILPLLCTVALWAENAPSECPFTLSPLVDSAIIGAGIGVNIAQYAVKATYGDYDWGGRRDYDKGRVWCVDRPLIHGYNWHLDKASDIAVGLSAALPILCLADTPEYWKEILVMYAETALFAHGTKELSKALIGRKRPYMYTDSLDGPGVDGRDWKDSFPSGHSTMAFAGATFASYVFWKDNPSSPMRYPVLIASYTLASVTAGLRIASGNHFLTDTIAGAGIGIFSGLCIPYLHTLKRHHKNNIVLQGLQLNGNGVSYRLQL